MIVILLFIGLRTVCASGQTGRPVYADIDSAIQICSVGTSRDVHVDVGLNRLKERMLSGKKAYPDSEIPRVLGVGDKSKIKLFKTIQKCVIGRVYPEDATRGVEDSLPGEPGLRPINIPKPPAPSGD